MLMSDQSAPPALYRMYHSTVLSAPIAAVWAEMRDFAATLRICFADGVSDITWLEGGSADRIPSRISFALQPGNLVVEEEVTARSDDAYSLSYRTVGVALSFASYAATFTLRPITTDPGATFIEWSREFGLTPETNPDEFLAFYQGLADAEIARAAAHFSRHSL
jgi:hypothetical protein